jgi:hypothetical protein
VAEITRSPFPEYKGIHVDSEKSMRRGARI